VRHGLGLLCVSWPGDMYTSIHGLWCGIDLYGLDSMCDLVGRPAYALEVLCGGDIAQSGNKPKTTH